MKTKKKTLEAEGGEHDAPGRSEKGVKRHFPPKKENTAGEDRCEKCMFWHMRDPRQKGTSCFERGFFDHDVCTSYTAKPPRIPHALIRDIQLYPMQDIFFVQDVLDERAQCIKQQMKKTIRTMLRKQGNAVVYYRIPGEKKRHGKVERVTASSVMMTGAHDEKVRVDYVIEVISLEEYRARKTNKINKREEAGRKV